jgi:hypothetical protein
MTTQPWESEFDERFGRVGFRRNNVDWEVCAPELKHFITSTRLSAYAEGKKDALNDGGGSGEGINTSEYNRGIKDGRHEHPRAYDIGYKDGGHDALKKVLESLPEELSSDETGGYKVFLRGYNEYRLAAREIIKKLIKD